MPSVNPAVEKVRVPPVKSVAPKSTAPPANCAWLNPTLPPLNFAPRKLTVPPVSLFQPQFEHARCRVRTAWTRLVIRLVEHRSLRMSRQVLRVAMACSTSARIFACEQLTAR